MSKEMTPLQALKKIKQAKYFVDFELDAKVSEDYKKELDIIETALKRYSTIEQHLIKRGFDNLEDFIKQLDEYVEISEKEHKELMILKSQSCQNKLKALEIVKEKNVSICWLKDCKDRAEYNDLADKQEQLAQEEFDLLKEVLL